MTPNQKLIAWFGDRMQGYVCMFAVAALPALTFFQRFQPLLAFGFGCLIAAPAASVAFRELDAKLVSVL